MPIRGDLLDEFLDRFEPELLMGHLTAPEFERNLDLHVIAQKINPTHHFHPKIVRINRGAELNLLHPVRVLVLLGVFVLFGNLITKFTIIDNPAYRRHRVGRDLHQIDPMLAGDGQSLRRRNYTELASINSYGPNLPGANLAINPIK